MSAQIDKEDPKIQIPLISSQIFDSLKAIVLTVSGEIQLVSKAAANLLDRYFEGECLNSCHLPDPLKTWVEKQLPILQQSESIAASQSWQIAKNGRNLSIDLFCDFATEQHWLICCEHSILDRTGKRYANANEYSPVPHFQSIGLSKREAEILALVAAGKTNLQISQQLTISVKTVKKHVEHIFRKLNANSRIDAVNKALQQSDR
jgi:DNA-binding CsgD family transcriptional regulator